MPDNNVSLPVEALANAIGEINLKLIHVMTRQRAIEKVLNYYYSGFSDKVLAAWKQDLIDCGMPELVEAMEQADGQKA